MDSTNASFLTIISYFLLYTGVVKAQNNHSLLFNGVDTKITVPNSASLENISTGITIMANIKANSLSGNEDYILLKHATNANRQWGFRINGNGFPSRIWSELQISGSYYTLVADTTTIKIGQFHHVAMTYDGNTWRLYQDGEIVAAQSLSGSISTSTAEVVFGNFGHVNPANVLVDNLSVWSVALDSAQIAQGTDCKLTGTEEGLVGYWNLDEGEGTTVNDQTTNGNDGTMVGSFIWSVDTASNMSPCDFSRPMVSISQIGSPNINPRPLMIMFSETVLGFNLSDIVVINGTPQNLLGDGVNYTLDIQITGDGFITVQVPSGAVQDQVGNPNIESNEFITEFYFNAVDLEVQKNIYVNGQSLSGVILKDEIGNCWKLTVDSSGLIKSHSIPCPE